MATVKLPIKEPNNLILDKSQQYFKDSNGKFYRRINPYGVFAHNAKPINIQK